MGQTGRRGNARPRALRWTFPSFLALFTVDARGGAADRSGKESRERNKLSRSIDCPPSLSVPFPSLVARVEWGERGTRSLGQKLRILSETFLGFGGRARELAVAAFEQSPIYTAATTASDSAQFSGFYAPEPSKEPPAVVAAPSASER